MNTAKQLELLEQEDQHLLNHFMSYIEVDKNDCWEWTGTYQKDNRPFYYSTNRMARHAGIEIVLGNNIPKYTRIEASCGNPKCVNPHHMIVGTTAKLRKKESPKNPQGEKRRVQKELNNRLVTYAFKNPTITGGAIILAGTKITQAARPYLRAGIANQILIAEHNRSVYATVSDTMRAFPEDFYNIALYSRPTDIFEAATKTIRAYPMQWTGFDLDFDGTLTAKKKGQLIELIETIDAPAWWIRLGITVRPYTTKRTREILDETFKYICSQSSIEVKDLATGEVFEYRDSVSMQVMQVICTRR